MNNRQQIVGYTADLLFSDIHGYVRTQHDEFTAIDVPGGVNTMALGINDAGAIVGGYEQANASTQLREGDAQAASNPLMSALVTQTTRD